MLRDQAACEPRICRSARTSARGAGPCAGLPLLHGGDVGGILEDAVDGYEAGIRAEEEAGGMSLRIWSFTSVGDLGIIIRRSFRRIGYGGGYSLGPLGLDLLLLAIMAP